MTTMEIKEMEARAVFVPGQLADSSAVRGAVIAFDDCQTHVHRHSSLSLPVVPIPLMGTLTINPR